MSAEAFITVGAGLRRLGSGARRLLGACLATIALGACSPGDPEGADEEPIPVRIAAPESILATPMLLAFEQDAFAPQGLGVVQVPVASGKEALAALLAGNADMATVADPPIVAAGFERADFRILATFIYSFSHGSVVARRDRGIEKVSDLRGRRVGVTLNTTSAYYLEGLLLENGVSDEALQLVAGRAPQLVDWLEDGTVDAISTWQPHVYRAQSALGDDAVTFSDAIYRSTFNLVARPSADAEDGEVARRVLRGLASAIDALKQDRDGALRIVAGRLQLPEDEYVEVAEPYVFELSLDQSLILALESDARRFQARSDNSTEVLPNFLSLIDTEPLRSVSPHAVTLIE